MKVNTLLLYFIALGFPNLDNVTHATHIATALKRVMTGKFVWDLFLTREDYGEGLRIHSACPSVLLFSFLFFFPPLFIKKKEIS